MKRNIIIAAATAALSFVLSVPASGWGREGHETIAKLAELNLDKSAKKTIEKYLGGHSIVYYAKWCDDIRKTPEYAFTHYYHTATTDAEFNYAPRESGDAIYAIENAVETLKDWKNLPDSVVSVNIKFLIHYVGDMHCPSHVYYTGRDQNIDVRIEDAGHKFNTINLHGMWDYGLIKNNRFMSATEWATELNQVLSKEQKKEMASGSPREWLHGNAVRCVSQFDLVSPDAKLGPDFVNYAMPLIETQITYGGIRLASILNSIF